MTRAQLGSFFPSADRFTLRAASFNVAGMNEHLAWIESPERTFLCRSVRRAPQQAFSPVTGLIQGIWETDPAMARKYLRGRILTTLPELTPMDLGFVRVAAKRISCGVLRAEFGRNPIQDVTSLAGRLIQPIEPFVPLGTILDIQNAMKLVFRQARLMESQDVSQGPRFERDRAVAAILLSADGEVLEATTNANAQNRTLHAEVRAIQSHWARRKAPLAPGVRLIVSLQCCRMCAGLLVTSAQDPSSLTVFYGRADGGPMARRTELQLRNLEKPLEIP